MLIAYIGLIVLFVGGLYLLVEYVRIQKHISSSKDNHEQN